MWFFKSILGKILFAILLLIVGAGISFFVWNYNRHIHPDPIFQYFFYGPPGQPKSKEEAQKRVTFTIYKPSYKPSYINPHESLILFGSDRYAKVNYAQEYLRNVYNYPYGLALEETTATPEEIAKVSKEGIVANDPYAANIRPIDVCGTQGFVALSKSQELLIFVKDETRVLLQYYTNPNVGATPLSDSELLHIACSLQPITVSK